MDGKLLITLLVLVICTAAVVVGVKITTDAPQNQQASQKQEDVVKEPAEEEDDKEEQPPAADEKEPEEEPGEEVDPDQWNLLLANPDHPLPEDFSVETEQVQGSFEMDVRVAPAMREMIQAAKEDGVDLLVCSAYRSVEKQKTLFQNQVDQFVSGGMSQEDAVAKTATMIAVPGTSEHHTGLCADIVTPTHQTLDEAFGETEAGQWLQEHAVEYGFILRYPKDKQDVTKIIYESWHYRYVGKQHAQLIKDSGLCLEEYLEQMSK